MQNVLAPVGWKPTSSSRGPLKRHASSFTRLERGNGRQNQKMRDNDIKFSKMAAMHAPDVLPSKLNVPLTVPISHVPSAPAKLDACGQPSLPRVQPMRIAPIPLFYPRRRAQAPAAAAEASTSEDGASPMETTSSTPIPPDSPACGASRGGFRGRQQLTATSHSSPARSLRSPALYGRRRAPPLGRCFFPLSAQQEASLWYFRVAYRKFRLGGSKGAGEVPHRLARHRNVWRLRNSDFHKNIETAEGFSLSHAHSYASASPPEMATIANVSESIANDAIRSYHSTGELQTKFASELAIVLSEIESDMSSEGGHGPNTSASMPVLSSVPEEHGTGTQAMDESAQAGAAFVQLAARPLAGAPLPQDVTMADAAAGARAQPQAPQGAAQAQGGSPFQFSKIMTAAAAAHDAVAGRPTVQPKPAPPPKPAPSAAAAVKVQQQQQQQAAAAQAAAAGKPYRPTLGTTGAPGFKLVSEFTRHFKLGRELGKGHFSSVCHARLREKPLTNEQLAAMEPRRADAPPGTPAAARLIEARLNQALNLQPPPSPPSPGASKPAPQPDGGAQAGAEVSAEAAAIMAQHAQYPPEVAVKILRKPSSEKQMELLMREVEICNLLSGHRAFCTLLDRFESEDSFYLVLELCDGGELFDRICDDYDGAYPEEEARKLMRVLFEAVAAMHAIGVIHRDLKVENVLFVDRDLSTLPKISDFGLSRRVDEPNQALMLTGCGTVGYVAPEIIRKEAYNCKVDIFALGVIAYITLSGTEPFTGDNDMETAQRTKAGDYAFDGDEWLKVSPMAKNFIDACLHPDPQMRPGALEALEHVWLNVVVDGK